MSPKATVYRLSISAQRGVKKTNVPRVRVDVKRGIIGDGHGRTERQISLLPIESFGKLDHPDLAISPGDFGENITTQHLDFSQLQVGTKVRLGNGVRLEIIQIGKECHDGCAILEITGDCIMPREGVFARVLAPGVIQVGDGIEIEANNRKRKARIL